MDATTTPETLPATVTRFTLDEDAARTVIADLLDAARDVMGAPAGMVVRFDGDEEDYRWEVEVTLADAPRMSVMSTWEQTRKLGDPEDVVGADAALAVLREAVEGANEALYLLGRYVAAQVAPVVERLEAVTSSWAGFAAQAEKQAGAEPATADEVEWDVMATVYAECAREVLDTVNGTKAAEHPEHVECADGCGLDLDHVGACRPSPTGRVLCSHEEDVTGA